jgi:hypothetical protein
MAKANPTFTVEELASETWKPVVGFEDRYRVSNLGRIKGLRPGKKYTGNHILTEYVHSNGYVYICLYDNRGHTIRLHRVVAEAFIGTRPTGYQVNHKDGDKANNRIENLEYVTASENAIHAVRLGLMKSGDQHWSRQKPWLTSRGDKNGSRRHPEKVCRGEQSVFAKLTEKQVRKIKMRMKEGERSCDLAKEYGVHRDTIGLIKRNKTWRHII